MVRLLFISPDDDYGLRPKSTVKVCPLYGMVTVMRYVAEGSGKGFVARLYIYWFVLKRITPVVSASLVERGSLIGRPGVAPEIMVSPIVGARSAGVEPSQFVKLILTGMVRLYLNTLVPSALIGGRKPLSVEFHHDAGGRVACAAIIIADADCGGVISSRRIGVREHQWAGRRADGLGIAIAPVDHSAVGICRGGIAEGNGEGRIVRAATNTNTAGSKRRADCRRNVCHIYCRSGLGRKSAGVGCAHFDRVTARTIQQRRRER